MSEKRDLWVSLGLLLAGLGLLAWNAAQGRPFLGVLAALLGVGGALACLPIRVRHGQARNVEFGVGVALVLVSLAPGPAAAGGLLRALPWLVAALALLLPVPTLPERPRSMLLGGALLLALLAGLALAGLGVPRHLSGLFLAGTFHLAVQTFHARERRVPAPPPGPRVCVMGGSYDPFHVGHRALAQAVLRVCDRLLVVPAGVAPHKLEAGEPTSFHHRLAMARLGVEGLPRTEVLQLEGRREGPSYTVDTLAALRRTLPAGTRLLLLVGADMLLDFPTWRAWEEILPQVTLLVAGRPGYELRVPDAVAEHHPAVERLDLRPVDVSSTAVRRAYRTGGKVEDLLSPAVRAYIRDHGLYAPS